MSPRRSYSDLLKCWESDCGRKSGWQIERNGVPFARLTDPQLSEMFWDNYRFELCTKDEELIGRSKLAEFWLRSDDQNLRWRSLQTFEIIETALPADAPFTEDGRFLVRGLYLTCRAPNLADRLVLLSLKLLRRKGKKQNDSEELILPGSKIS